jgi:hypothetical protein
MISFARGRGDWILVVLHARSDRSKSEPKRSANNDQPDVYLA